MEWDIAFLGTPCLAPFDVGADVFGFALCDATVDGDIKLCAGLVAVGLLKMLLEMQLITKEEYKKIVRISAAHYDAENICV